MTLGITAKINSKHYAMRQVSSRVTPMNLTPSEALGPEQAEGFPSAGPHNTSPRDYAQLRNARPDIHRR